MSALLWLLEGWLPKREVTSESVAEPELKPLFSPSPCVTEAEEGVGVGE